MGFITNFIAIIDGFNPWYMLFVAILFSTFGTICLKFSNGFEHKKPILGVIVGYAIFFILVNIIFKHIDISIGYAVWSGLSTLMVSLSGIIIFKERVTIQKIIGLVLIIIGVSGLSYFS